jgi:fructose/tagatose bisphosphate aldolase
MIVAGRGVFLLQELGDPTARAAAEEYWTPSRNWRVLEYIDRVMTIVREVQAPSILDQGAARVWYMQDLKLLGETWPNRE